MFNSFQNLNEFAKFCPHKKRLKGPFKEKIITKNLSIVNLRKKTLVKFVQTFIFYIMQFDKTRLHELSWFR